METKPKVVMLDFMSPQTFKEAVDKLSAEELKDLLSQLAGMLSTLEIAGAYALRKLIDMAGTKPEAQSSQLSKEEEKLFSGKVAQA